MDENDFTGTPYTTVLQADAGRVVVVCACNHDGTETATIRFGTSFTLRVDEDNLGDLIDVLMDASTELHRRRKYMQSDSE